MSILNKTKDFTVSVEGNIGSGKSTLLNYFAKNEKNVTCQQEPVDDWANVRGIDALNQLYSNPERWAFSFNMLAIVSRLHRSEKSHDSRSVVLQERSVGSSRNVFVHNSYRTGEMNDLELGVIVKWYDYLESTNQGNVDLYVYLKTTPEICLSRVQSRGRPAENGLSLAFLQRLHELHDRWLVDREVFTGKGEGGVSSRPLLTPVLVLDASQSLEEMVTLYQQHREEILGRERN